MRQDGPNSPNFGENEPTKRGTKHLFERQSFLTQHISSLHAVTAAGKMLKTLIIYKNNIPKNLSHDENVAEDFMLKHSESGFINCQIFKEWITAILIPWTQGRGRSGPFLLTMDNAAPHISYDIFNLCKENNIEIFSMLPTMQPTLNYIMRVRGFRPSASRPDFLFIKESSL